MHKWLHITESILLNSFLYKESMLETCKILIIKIKISNSSFLKNCAHKLKAFSNMYSSIELDISVYDLEFQL